MTTIKDVAKRAGVSISTVSRVINKSGYVGNETEEKVRLAMAELNFSPNGVARGLVIGSTNTVGVMIPDVKNPFYADVVSGIETAAFQSGFDTILCNFDWDLDREKIYLDKLRQRWSDGIILAGSRSEFEDLIQLSGDIPFVVIDRRDNPIGGSVWMDNEVGGKVATQHLLELGCKKLVHVAGPPMSPSAIGRRDGFLHSIEDAKLKGLNISGEVIEGDYRYEGGYNIGIKLLSSRNRPDGIFAANDMTAIGIIQAAQTLGLSIPGELKIIGYDNIAMGEYIYPKLTTIDQPGHAMGRASFELLFELIQSKERVHKEKEFTPKLVVRQST